MAGEGGQSLKPFVGDLRKTEGGRERGNQEIQAVQGKVRNESGRDGIQKRCKKEPTQRFPGREKSESQEEKREK